MKTAPRREGPGRLGLYGGSFDPIHQGHLILAERAADALKLDRVLFIPAHVSPFKSAVPPAPAKVRLEMIKAAIRGNPRFAVTDLEIKRGGASFTIDTVTHFQRRSSDKMFFLLGSDAVSQLDGWKRIGDLAGRVTFAILMRPGTEEVRVPDVAKKYTVVAAPMLEISSTEIRLRVQEGRTIRYLVPREVEAIIRKKGLYAP